MLLRGFSLHTCTYLIGYRHRSFPKCYIMQVKQHFHNDLKHFDQHTFPNGSRGLTLTYANFSKQDTKGVSNLNSQLCGVDPPLPANWSTRPKAAWPYFSPRFNRPTELPGAHFPSSVVIPLLSYGWSVHCTGSSLGFSFKTKHTASHR